MGFVILGRGVSGGIFEKIILIFQKNKMLINILSVTRIVIIYLLYHLAVSHRVGLVRWVYRMVGYWVGFHAREIRLSSSHFEAAFGH